jgi:predicted TIM-barrel fold metal-dependent hydrolase
MRRHKVSALYLLPAQYRYNLSDWCLDALLEPLAEARVPVIVCYDEVARGAPRGDQTDWDAVVAEAVRRHPDRFVAFTLLNPHRGRHAMLRELARCHTLGLRGVKLIPHYQDYPEEGPLIDVACQWAHEHRQIILNHYWGPARHLERLIRQYPGACYVTGHLTTEYAALMKERENLYVCSCPLWRGPRDCEEVVAKIGADRLMFGSDLQDLPIAWGLGPILFARLGPGEKRLILGGNLQRVLRRYSLEP